jgi:molybdopterin molybdotransferase
MMPTSPAAGGAPLAARDALRTIWEALEPLDPSPVTLGASLGRVLAEEIVSREDIPPFDNSAMDGFALRSEDASAPGATLAVVGEIPAGVLFGRPLGRGEAARIMTGAAVPPGCDAVAQQEWTESDPQGMVRVLRPVPAGHNIRRAGSDIVAGATVLSPGTVLRPQEIGLLASLGRLSVIASPRPVVAVLTTGNELVPAGAPLSPAVIRDSNAPMLAALLEEEGCEVLPLGIARDDAGDLRTALGRGLSADMLVSAGGVSVGAYDLVGETLRELGVTLRFWKVNIRPGMPLLFGTRGRTAVFGLPGNPVSAMITFLQFVRPALRRLKGGRTEAPGVRLHAALEHPLAKEDGKRHFVRGILGERNGAPVVRTTGPQVSNILSSLSLANCLIILPEEGRSYRPGDPVEVELL